MPSGQPLPQEGGDGIARRGFGGAGGGWVFMKSIA